MATLAPNPFIAEIHESTRRLRYWMDSLFDSASQPLPAQPQQMQDLVSELLHAGEWLSARPADPDPELDHELAEYRTHVERLRTLLPSIQAALLAESARLEQERSRLQAASEWVRLSRQTL